ncbi:MAG: LptA/OstA family protein, partial [Pyrinomonadaceae bacterium]
LKGDAVNADLFADRKLKYAVVNGNGFVRQTTPERTTSVSAPNLNVTFNDQRQLSTANTVGQSIAQVVPNQVGDYSLITMSAPHAIRVLFKGEGLIEKMQTDGRTTIQMDVPNRDADAANKRVTADTVNTIFNASGKDIQRAEAVGNAELFVEPLRAAPDNYKTTVNAPRFDCEFFPTGNNAKSCVGRKKTKTVRVPTVASKDRGTQTLLADQLTASFNEQSKDVERFDAYGNTKFTELDRNAIAGQMTFTRADEILRIRGGEPTVWDARARAKAREIDWNTRSRKSYLRGNVSTTYYSRKQMADAAPFAASDKPVFLTSDNAELDQATEAAVYTGNVRGWQENNYVRGDRFVIQQPEGKFTAEGNVQSAIYNVKQKLKGKESTVPVFVSSRVMAYERDKRLIQYRDNVDIRQGTDRITSGFAEVYLSESNEVSKTIAENSVVITQPGRRAAGNWVQYTAGDETAIIRGNPASINDSVNGSSQAAEFTYMMRENRFISEGRTKQNGSGRIRSTYKVSPDK